MYHNHFGLSEEPFGASPDSRFFFETEQHREALATAYYAVRQRRGFALLFSNPGLGKTSVVVRLIQMLEYEAEVAYLPHPHFDRTNVLEAIMVALGLDSTDSSAHNHRLFYEYLASLHSAGRTCVLVFDEAHDLSRETLEAIRTLSNFETPKEKLVQVILVGLPRLARMLNQAGCEQLKQRINLVARLQPLTCGEVHDYVTHRLTVAGASREIFTTQALDAIACASGGELRSVNTICFNALTLAYALERQKVSCREVAEVVRDLDLTVEPPPAIDGGLRARTSTQREFLLTASENEELNIQ